MRETRPDPDGLEKEFIKLNNNPQHGNPFEQHSDPFAQHGNPFEQHSDPFAQHGNPFEQHSDPFEQHNNPFAGDSHGSGFERMRQLATLRSKVLRVNKEKALEEELRKIKRNRSPNHTRKDD